MKKVLFGIMALSMAAFAATTNPGASGNDATVPVLVTAEIITAPVGLVITDEAGTVLNELEIKHDPIIKGKATDDGKKTKGFFVRRVDETGTDLALVPTTGIGSDSTALSVKLDIATTTLTHLTESGSTLNSTLSLSGGSNPISSTEYEHVLTVATDKKHYGEVTSTIPMNDLNASTLKPGVHNNKNIVKPNLSVTLIP